MRTNTIQNFAKRLVMVLAVGLMAVNVLGAAIPSKAPADGKQFIIAMYDASADKYYALYHLDEDGGLYCGEECTLNGSNQVTAIADETSPIDCLWFFESTGTDNEYYISFDNSGTKMYLYKNGTTGDNYKIKATDDYKSTSKWLFKSGTANGVTTYSVKTTKSGATKHTVLRGETDEDCSYFCVEGTDDAYEITLLEIVPRTVSFNAQGGSFDDPSIFVNTNQITEASGGAGITLPLANPSASCISEGWAFYGWATSQCSSSTTTAPAIVGQAGDIYYPVNNSTTLHAVYAKGEYTKITSTDDLNTIDKYFFAAVYSDQNYIMTNNWDANKLAAKQIDETSTGKYHAGKIIPSWCYTLEEGSSSWYIVDCNNSNTDHYLDTYYSAWYGHSKDDAFTFTYSTDHWVVQNVYSSGNRYFGFFNSDNTFNRTSTSTELLIYKVTSTPYYYSNPSCCAYEVSVSESGSSHLAAVDGMTFSSSSVATCGDASSRTITITVTPASGYTLFGDTKPVFTRTSGTVTATIGSVTDNGDGTFSYECTFNSNDNGAGTFAISPGQFSNYRTVCCTELGTIDGEASLTQAGNSVTISGWSDVSNVGTYTVKLYKKNGASWDLVSGTTSGGSAGAQGTRTGITSGSKSVTYTGLEVESEYKFTVQAIAGSSAYCDGAETAVTEINDIDVSSSPFKFRYAIYIDDGTNDNYEYYYIEPTGNTDEGSVDIDLSAHVDYYQFKIAGGFSGWWGQTGTSKIPASTEWELDGSNNVRLNTGAGGTYTFTVDYSSTNPAVTVTFPSADQDEGYVIYYDNSVLNWSSLYYRVGNNSSCSKVDVSLVPGTDKFYKVTTPDFDNMDAWHIANNYGWTGSNSIYRTKTSSAPAEAPKAITNSIAFQQYAVTEDITVIPTTTHSTGTDTGDAGNSNCEFYTINTPTSGMLTHNAAITSYSHGTVTVAYTNTSGSAASFTSGNADLAHRCVLTITATPATGYSLSSLQVNSSDFTSGNEHILAADATITAVFTAQTSTVTLQATSATTGSDQTVLATYDASMPLVTTADKTPAVAAISRTGYTFNGWWDATSGGKQYYSHSAGTIASANNWDKTGTQTLYAQWIAKEYTITLDREGGSTGAESVTATFDSGTLTGWSAPTKTGYTFGGYYSGDNGTGTLVISTSGVLQNSVTINAVNWTDASGHWIKEGGATVYAKWTANEYTISYKDQGDVAYSGSNSALLPTTHTYGAATDLVDGVKSGYRFDGWFDNSSCTGSAITSIGATAITANTTYYAKWTEVYTVTWKVNGSTYETGVVSGNSQVANGEKISAMATAPANNTLSCSSKFMGWSVTNIPAETPVNGSSNISALGLFTTVGSSPTITKDTVFYAVFAKQTNSDGYKYIGDAGTLADGEKYIFVDSKTAGSGHALKASDLAENSSAGKKGTAVSVSITSNAEGILITTENSALEFEYVSTGTKLKYADGLTTKYLFINGNGVGYKTGDSRSAYGTHQLYGWTNGSANRYVYYDGTNENFTISEDAQNMYAYIKQTPVYGDYRVQCDPNIVTVTYEANSGATSCENEEHDKRNDYTVCSSAPTRDYYTFAGWLCSADSKTYAASATIDNGAIDNNFTLTAQWTPVSYSISYNLNGGTNAADPISAYNVETTSALPTPTKGHDRFDGWYTDDGVWSNQVASITAGMHGNLTLYAKWTSRYEIVFDIYGGSSTTIYRAADENLESAVAGQGSKPSDPDAPTTCSTKTFVGWVESEIDDETDTKPATLTNATGKPTADKHYYATWALKSGLDIDAVEDNSFTGSGTEGYCSMTYGMKDVGDYILKNSVWSTDLTGSQVKIKVYHLSNSTADVLRISLINSSGTEVVGTDLTTTALNSNKTYAAYSSYVTLTPNSTVTGYKVALKTKNSNGTCVDKVTREVVATYSKYATSCCATKVTLSQNSPEHGTIAFGKTSVGTCGDQNVSLTITPEAGYQLHSYEVATGSGKVAPTSVSPAISLDNNSSAAQNITLTFEDETNGAYDVTATFTLMTVTSWTWTMNSAAIPDPLNLYVGQTARFDVAYTPSGVDASKKTYTRTKEDAYINWVGGKQATYSTISGKASTGENTTPVTFTHADGPTKTVNVKVLPLPLTHFVDLVHGKAFANVAATIEDNALSATKTTPTSDDWTTPNANDCESDHLHLVGWIREDWPALITYLNGGAQPTTTAIVGAGNDGSGNAYFIAAGASINVQTFDGVTFYAVWSKVE